MNVPLLNLRPQYESIQTELEAAALKVLRETKYILGPEVGELECALAGYTGAKYAISCASGSDALLLTLMALNIEPGDEVITTPFTFFATVSAITRLGAKPVLADIDPATFNIQVQGLRSKISNRTKAIIPVHLYGQCADMDALLQLGIPVVEDVAQAIGAKYKGKQAGTMGVMGTLSFFPTKNLGGAGDGGAILTNDPQLAERLRILRVHGMEPKYYHRFIGINSRLDTLQAAILQVKLKHLDRWAGGRQRNASQYDSRFTGSQVVAPFRDPRCTHVFNQYTIRVPHRDELRAHLAQLGIGSEVYYPVPLHLQECFQSLGYRPGDFPEAERASREVLSLPIYPELTPEQIEYVAKAIVAYSKT